MNKSLIKSGLTMTFVLVLIGCGGMLADGGIASPSQVPSPTVAPHKFVVTGNRQVLSTISLRCSTSAAQVEIKESASDEQTVSITFEGPEATNSKVVGQISQRAQMKYYDQAATDEIEVDSLNLTEILLSAQGPGLPLLEGDTNSPWTLICDTFIARFPGPQATPTATMAGSNSVVCDTIRKTVSGSLADAVSLYNSYSISLYQLGTIYSAWASGARGLIGSVSGAVKERLSRLIKIADNTATSAQNGNESRAVDGIVSFADSLDGFFAACP